MLAGWTTAELERAIVIQAPRDDILGAVYHVVEHFAMHTGQIVLLTKIYARTRSTSTRTPAASRTPTWHAWNRPRRSRALVAARPSQPFCSR